MSAKSVLLAHRLGAIAASLPEARVKGRGLMQGIDLGSTAWAADVARRCFEARLIIETCGPRDEVVKVMAPLTTPEEVLEQGLDILAGAVEASRGTFG